MKEEKKTEIGKREKEWNEENRKGDQKKQIRKEDRNGEKKAERR
jgi:hypothetical protein